jgi:hypothetical protein
MRKLELEATTILRLLRLLRLSITLSIVLAERVLLVFDDELELIVD